MRQHSSGYTHCKNYLVTRRPHCSLCGRENAPSSMSDLQSNLPTPTSFTTHSTYPHHRSRKVFIAQHNQSNALAHNCTMHDNALFRVHSDRRRSKQGYARRWGEEESEMSELQPDNIGVSHEAGPIMGAGTVFAGEARPSAVHATRRPLYIAN